jgi:hypothetical protein
MDKVPPESLSSMESFSDSRRGMASSKDSNSWRDLKESLRGEGEEDEDFEGGEDFEEWERGEDRGDCRDDGDEEDEEDGEGEGWGERRYWV